jgi:hypothetical protein
MLADSIANKSRSKETQAKKARKRKFPLLDESKTLQTLSVTQRQRSLSKEAKSQTLGIRTPTKKPRRKRAHTGHQQTQDVEVAVNKPTQTQEV